MAGFWENLIASFILAWRGYDPDNFNPRRQETRISLVLRADGKAYLKYLWALQYGVAWAKGPPFIKYDTTFVSRMILPLLMTGCFS